ncbi:MAG: lytic murein transglycosylase B [Lautropia sp.]|nr:lytic murein transglycosylase B [Lautropia sp.]
MRPDDFASRTEVKAFISDMAEKHGMDRDALLASFAQIAPNAQVLSLMNPPKTSIQRSWKAYRPRFLQPVRIDGGVTFWNQNAAALERATADYGVPSEIIVAIIGVETVYGRNTGNFSVLQALTTLGFDYPSRATYFKRELEEFLLYCHENEIDPLQPRGSYAGAIGTPQFMPGSIRRFATDFDGDGRIDLRASTTDAIGSVARFLQIHGWVKGKKTHYKAVLANDANPKPLLDRGPKPDLSIADLRSHGISSPVDLPADEPLLLVDLVNADTPPDYVIGTGNFYAITRYNRSFMYAMAVIDLADSIRRQRERALKAAKTGPDRRRRGSP